jgi:hypothetical protein
MWSRFTYLSDPRKGVFFYLNKNKTSSKNETISKTITRNS